MSIALHADTENYASIDDLLGDGSSRFFSQGYKSTNPNLHELAVSHTASESLLTAYASLEMRGVWSVKGSSDQTPHLGTTDVLVLACRMAEALLASRYSPEILPEAYLKSVIISGGREPVEGALSRIECQGKLEGSKNGNSSTLRFSVASMNAVLEVSHDSTELGLASVQSPSEDALVGASEKRLYGDLWSGRKVLLEDVQLKSANEDANARLSFEQEFSPGSLGDLRGLEAEYPHDLSALEYFVSTLQLGQALLYRLDSMERADSNTLWMRRTHITFNRPKHHEASWSETGLNVRLDRSRLVLRDGESWRCADIVGTHDVGEVVCSVAHRLPTSVAIKATGVDQ
ncbi:hypothetical protein MB46_19965 (plasmid) [Arthrobacter alpinus]|uniref:AvrD family protein n=1 Tax=Arthrobacter alpinus TaxID=656366 RepID=UPI0005C932D2|nr:AvrD family protein [Arthrobacter alpinus]ALV47803.1 hypothetical protein MB46_19165 [Arthrobacter alpinus]ALV47943.1 hypothetical protein MB46_19965 [Arthrobacter alpinus]